MPQHKPERPFQFDNASLSIELPRKLVPGQSWLFCMTGYNKTGEMYQAFLKLYPKAPFREQLLLRSQFDTACIAIIFATALPALFFAVTLRDAVYLWYAGHNVLRNNIDRRRARRTDDIGRIGGEEFVVLLYQCTAQNALAIAERICAQVRRAPVRWKDREITMTVSIGVAMVLATDAPNAALTRADAALYRAKHAARDRLCLEAAADNVSANPQ